MHNSACLGFYIVFFLSEYEIRYIYYPNYIFLVTYHDILTSIENKSLMYAEEGRQQTPRISFCTPLQKSNLI